MRAVIALICLAFAGAAAAQPVLSPADEAAAFTAAGFKRVNGQWQDCEDPGFGLYQAGAIDKVTDLNGDGRPEAFITEGGTVCYGNTGTAFALVSKQADGSWKLMAGSLGIPRVLQTKGVGGWPDLEIGGPGFCFAVRRWNGRAYAINRYEYDGKACRL